VLAARSRVRGSHPRLWRAYLAVMGTLMLTTEWLAPRRRVGSLTLVTSLLVCFDSWSTWVLVRSGYVAEGNPMVARVMDAMGDGAGLTVRAAGSVLGIVLLGWLADRHWEARGGLLVVLAVFAGLTLVHLEALAWLWLRAD
jgi:hypothetical protein